MLIFQTWQQREPSLAYDSPCVNASRGMPNKNFIMPQHCIPLPPGAESFVMYVEMAAKVLIKISKVTRKLSRHRSRGYFRRRVGFRAVKRGDECGKPPFMLMIVQR